MRPVLLGVEPTFNRDFFTTAAGVIPVLFLALTVQGDAFSKVIERLRSEYYRPSPLRAALTDLALIYFAIVIVIAGPAGEIISLLALKDQQASKLEAQMVFASIVFLVILLAGFLYGRLYAASHEKQQLELEPDEVLLWSGNCYPIRIFAIGHTLFVTDRRVVKMKVAYPRGERTECAPTDFDKIIGSNIMLALFASSMLIFPVLIVLPLLRRRGYKCFVNPRKTFEAAIRDRVAADSAPPPGSPTL